MMGVTQMSIIKEHARYLKILYQKRTYDINYQTQSINESNWIKEITDPTKNQAN